MQPITSARSINPTTTKPLPTEAETPLDPFGMPVNLADLADPTDRDDPADPWPPTDPDQLAALNLWMDEQEADGL